MQVDLEQKASGADVEDGAVGSVPQNDDVKPEAVLVEPKLEDVTGKLVETEAHSLIVAKDPEVENDDSSSSDSDSSKESDPV